MILRKQNSRRRVLHRLIVMLRKNHMRTFSTCLTIFIQKIHIDLLPQFPKNLLRTGFDSLFLMDYKLLQPAAARKRPGSHLHQGIRKLQPLQLFASIKNISSDFLQCIGKNDLLHFLPGKKSLFPERNYIFALPGFCIFFSILMCGKRIRRRTDYRKAIDLFRQHHPAVCSVTTDNFYCILFDSVMYFHNSPSYQETDIRNPFPVFILQESSHLLLIPIFYSTSASHCSLIIHFMQEIFPKPQILSNT